MKRYNPSYEEGLTSLQVEERIKEDLNYKDVSVPTKTIKRIISDNFFTLFNFLNFGLAAAIAMVGAYKNMLFIGTVILNMIISTVQEIRAKKIVDKLSQKLLNILEKAIAGKVVIKKKFCSTPCFSAIFNISCACSVKLNFAMLPPLSNRKKSPRALLFYDFYSSFSDSSVILSYPKIELIYSRAFFLSGSIIVIASTIPHSLHIFVLLSFLDRAGGLWNSFLQIGHLDL